MHSVGEVMAIGRTFTESLSKAMASLEVDPQDVKAGLDEPGPYRVFAIFDALRAGLDIREIHHRTSIDPFFIASIARIVAAEGAISIPLDAEELRELKRVGPHRRDHRRRLGHLDGGRARRAARPRRLPDLQVRRHLRRRVPAQTPYFYSTYEDEDEVVRGENPSVVVLGSGPNRIGQGVEFDYACVHASYALKDAGYDSVMVNSNPETVSTDYDASTRLYFEPLTAEHALEVIRREEPEGVILQFGGQSPLKLAHELEKAGVRILGSSPDAIDLAEDRSRFRAAPRASSASRTPLRHRHDRRGGPRGGLDLGYPVVVRPVLRPRRAQDGDRVQRRGSRLVLRTSVGRALYTRSSSTSSWRTTRRWTSTPSRTGRTST
jgi:carbamoyl-phosphate synthase large subunit